MWLSWPRSKTVGGARNRNVFSDQSRTRNRSIAAATPFCNGHAVDRNAGQRADPDHVPAGGRHRPARGQSRRFHPEHAHRARNLDDHRHGNERSGPRGPGKPALRIDATSTATARPTSRPGTARTSAGASQSRPATASIPTPGSSRCAPSARRTGGASSPGTSARRVIGGDL